MKSRTGPIRRAIIVEFVILPSALDSTGPKLCQLSRYLERGYRLSWRRCGGRSFLPASGLSDFVRSLAHRIAKFPTSGLVAIKDRVNAIGLAPVDDFRRDSDLFGTGAQSAEAQNRFQAALKRGFQTREAEMDLARLLGELGDG